VIYVFRPDCKPKAKDKYLLVMSASKAGVAYFFINTDPCAIAGLMDAQIPVRVQDNPFLDHDSFCDTSWLYLEDYQEIERQLMKDMNVRLRGLLDESSRKAVLEVIKKSRHLSPRDKQFLLKQLQAT
jgi:hypothetical protein